MAYRIIPENCKNCGTCAENCPGEAISPEGNYYVIDPENCLSCGACQGYCEHDAIVED